MSEPSWIDQPATVRIGEELNKAALEAYLLAHLPEVNGLLTVTQFPRGYSNLTYLIRLGDQEFVLRRPPFGAEIKSAHDMGREYRILLGLAGVYPKTPRALLYTDDTSILGAPFYVMERVPGVILRNRAPAGLTITPAAMKEICAAMVGTLVELHAVNYEVAGLADLGKPAGYVERQVRGWTQRYQKAATDQVEDMETVAAWLAAHQPGVQSGALIHNDFKLDNLVLDPADLRRVVAVLDWEMATVGDPLMDLGTALGYWVQPGDPPELQQLGLTVFPGSLTRTEVVALYGELSGRPVNDIAYYYVFGLFKLAVIAQQIYYRFRQGHTQDPRFAGLDAVVVACAARAAYVAATGTLY